jgi:hypothetical protein
MTIISKGALPVFLALSAASFTSAVSGSCRYTGADNCWSAQDSVTCAFYTTLGCEWSSSACKPTSTDASCSAYGSNAECTAASSLGCAWDEPSQCDAYDTLSCTAGDYLECTKQISLDFITAIIGANDAEDAVEKYMDNYWCTCLPLYFSCVYSSECGNPLYRTMFSDSCVLMVDALVSDNAACSSNWCSMGVSQGDSVWDVMLDWTSDAKTWTKEQRDTFLRAVVLAVPGMQLDWMSFDGEGTISVNVPDGTVISDAQLADMSSLIDGLADDAVMQSQYEVSGVHVMNKHVASVDEEEWPPKDDGVGAGSRAVVGLAGVAAVVGAALFAM